jgi:DNA-binding MarR family transcriptional regulator
MPSSPLTLLQPGHIVGVPMIGIPSIWQNMDAEANKFFMKTVEIRILAAMIARFAGRSLEERFSAQNIQISGLQYGIIRTLSYQSYTMSELSRKFVLDPSTLVPVIATLERKGLLERKRDPNDRRRMPLFLTEQGAALLHNTPLAHEDDLLFRCLEQMGREKAEALLGLLRELVQQMPGGGEILEEVSSRIYAYEKGENVANRPHWCPKQEDEPKHEHDRVIRRSIRRHTRKNRS